MWWLSEQAVRLTTVHGTNKSQKSTEKLEKVHSSWKQSRHRMKLNLYDKTYSPKLLLSSPFLFAMTHWEEAHDHLSCWIAFINAHATRRSLYWHLAINLRCFIMRILHRIFFQSCIWRRTAEATARGILVLPDLLHRNGEACGEEKVTVAQTKPRCLKLSFEP